MDARSQLDQLISAHGGKLARRGNHQIWKFPDGKTFTMANTPSDPRSDVNALAQLRRLLGVKREKREKVKNPGKTKKGAPGKQKFVAETVLRAKRNPLAGVLFRPASVKYDDCFAMRLERVPMTPVWCILRNMIGYGGRA